MNGLPTLQENNSEQTKQYTQSKNKSTITEGQAEGEVGRYVMYRDIYCTEIYIS